MSATYPSRINTGWGRTSIVFPTNEYCGDPEQFNFKSTHSSFNLLKQILGRSNLQFSILGSRNKVAQNSHGNLVERTHWVAVVGELSSPLFIWQFEPMTSSKVANNFVYFAGEKYKTSDFVKLAAAEQDKLLEPLVLRAWVSEGWQQQA